MKNKEENNYIWDLDIEPKLDILDEESSVAPSLATANC